MILPPHVYIVCIQIVARTVRFAATSSRAEADMASLVEVCQSSPHHSWNNQRSFTKNEDAKGGALADTHQEERSFTRSPDSRSGH